MKRTDEEIIALVRAGRMHIYAELIDRYRDRAFALAARMLRNRRDAEEATQDAFLHAYQALGSFRGGSSFGTWFYRILYNGCLSRLRKTGRGHHADGELDDYSAPSAAGASPADDAERNDLLALVGSAIGRLPPGYAAVLSLFYLQDLTLDEICRVTELPLSNVKVRLHRARLLLTRQLRREAIYDEVVS